MKPLLWIGEIIFEKILAGLLAYAREKKAAYDRAQEIKKEASDSVKKLKDAKDGKEVEDASDDALNGV